MVRDVSQLVLERNVFRYLPVPVAVRVADDASLVDSLRVIIAATLSKSEFTVSLPTALPASVQGLLDLRDVSVTVESDASWLAGIASPTSPLRDEQGPRRLRLIAGGSRDALATAVAGALDGTPDVAVYAHEVTQSGRVELLPFLHEQAISITAHRFGNPSTLSDGVI